MTETTLHPTPALRAAAVEQLRAVGIAVRREAAVLVLLVAAYCAVALVATWRGDGPLPYGMVEDLTVLGWSTGIAAFLAPFLVWRGERPFGSSPLWFLPVDHRPHALLKVGAGGVWLVAALAAVVLCLLVLALVTGGSVGIEQTRRVLDPSEPLGVRTITARPPVWQWFAPFTGAVALYLLGSAVQLGARHPWRWIAGGALVAVGLMSTVPPESVGGGLQDAVVGAWHHLTVGPYGLDALVAGGVEGLESIHRLPSQRVGTNVWLELPTPGRWIGATILWLGIGLAALLAAVSRHRQG